MRRKKPRSGSWKISSWASLPGMRAQLEAGADLDALDRLDAHDRLAEAAVQAGVAAHVGPEPGERVERPHLEDAAERVVVLAGRLDRGLHPLGRLRVETSDGALVHPVEVAGDEVVAERHRLVADAHDVAADLGAVAAQDGLRDAAGGDAGGGLAGAGALQDRAQVVGAVLEHPREVGVPGAGQRDGLHLVVGLPDRHPVLGPLGEVEVGDLEGEGAADGAAVAQPGLDLHAVGLDLHPPAAPVSELSPRQVGVDVVGDERETGRQSLDHREERGAVGFPGCAVGEWHGPAV